MNRRSVSRAVAVLVTGCGMAGVATGQNMFVWTGAAGNGNWNDQLNWLNVTTSNVVSGFPTITDSVIFATNASVFGGGFQNLNNVGTLTLGASFGSTTTIGGLVMNTGTITFLPDSENAFITISVIDQRLFVPASTPAILSGSGVLRLTGSETGIEGAGLTVSTLGNFSGHTIEGGGTILNLSLNNSGDINATGNLNFGNVSINNSFGGDISIGSSGVLTLQAGSTIFGGNLSGTQGGLLTGGGTLNGVSTTGSFAIDGSSITFQNSILNNGTISVGGTQAIGPGSIVVASGSTVTLVGNGVIELNDSEAAITGQFNSTLFHSDGHVIRGEGILGVDSLVNLGLIEATGSGILALSDITGVSGRVAVASGSTFTFNGLLQQASITLADTTSSFIFEAGRLEVTSFAGDLIVSPPFFSTPVFAPGAGGTAVSTITGDFRQLTGSTVLEIELGGTKAGLFDQLLIGGDATLLGSLSVVLLNGFTLAAGQFFDIISIEGTLTGAFLGLEEGAIVSSFGGGDALGGVDLFITYRAGDGNDIALFTVPAPGATGVLVMAGLLAPRRRRV